MPLAPPVNLLIPETPTGRRGKATWHQHALPPEFKRVKEDSRSRKSDGPLMLIGQSTNPSSSGSTLIRNGRRKNWSKLCERKTACTSRRLFQRLQRQYSRLSEGTKKFLDREKQLKYWFESKWKIPKNKTRRSNVIDKPTSRVFAQGQPIMPNTFAIRDQSVATVEKDGSSGLYLHQVYHKGISLR